MAILWLRQKQDWVGRTGTAANDVLYTVPAGKKILIKQFRLGLDQTAGSPTVELKVAGVNILGPTTPVVAATNVWDFCSEIMGEVGGAAARKPNLNNAILLAADTIEIDYGALVGDTLDVMWYLTFFELDQV